MHKLNLLPTDKLKLEHICDYESYPFAFSEDHICKLPNGDLYTIKEGTIFDFASIPMIIMWLFNKRSQARRAVAYAVHDSMYIDKYKTRKNADRVFLQIMNKVAPKSKLANYVQFYGVRLFGGLYWNN